MRANKRSEGQNQSDSAAGGRRSVRTWAHGHTHTPEFEGRGLRCLSARPSGRAGYFNLATVGSHLEVQLQVGDPCWLLGRDVTDVSERVSAAQLSCSSPHPPTPHTPSKKHLDLCILIDFRLLLANHARKQALRRPKSVGFRRRRPA